MERWFDLTFSLCCFYLSYVRSKFGLKLSENIKFRTPCLLLLLLTSFIIRGQDNDFYNGRILDVTDQSPVAFATIRLKHYALGVISNEDGSFKLPVELQSYGDSLVISSLGYEDSLLKLSDFQLGTTRIVLLEPSVEILEEVVVSANRKKLSAERIITKALQSIPQNYPRNPFSYIGYYRDYQLIDEQYVNLNEAIIQIFDGGFAETDYESTEARIIKLQKNQEFPRDSTSTIAYDYSTNSKTIPDAFIEGYSGNELIILRIHDAIRNHRIPAFSYVDKLIRDFKVNHQFNKQGIIPYQGDLVYRLGIRKYDRNIRVKGEIYVSAKDFGILKMDYRVYRQDLSNTGKDIRPEEDLLYGIVVEYIRSEEMNSYFPNYLSFHNYFEFTPPPVFYAKTLTWDKNKQLFELEFNQPLSAEYISRINNFKLYFYDKRIRLTALAISTDGKKIQMKPKQSNRQHQLLALIDKKEMEKNNFKIRFGKVRDTNGNLINDSDLIGGEQYREFFVQQQIPEADLPEKDLLMRKDQPIFGDQPRFEAVMDGDYWMNTPLKK